MPDSQQPTPNGQDANGAAEQVTAGDSPIRDTVRYVLVPTTVLDPDGHGYVNGLRVNDFELLGTTKNRRRSQVNRLSRLCPVVLAVQANSEVEPLLPVMKKSGLLLQGLVTGEHGDAAILAFDHRMRVMQDFTDDPAKLDDAMHKITPGSSTSALVDAVVEADHMLRLHDRQNVRRRVIILMSRNRDGGSEAKLQETIRNMQFDNVIVYSVDISRVKTALLKEPDYPAPAHGRIPPEALPSTNGQVRTDTNTAQEQTGNVLNGLPPILHGIHDLFKKTPAEAFTYFTGGYMYSFANQRGLEDAITDIGKDLNSQYLLSYSLSAEVRNEPGFHNIRVVVNRPGLKVRTRPGYWWGGGQQ